MLEPAGAPKAREDVVRRPRRTLAFGADDGHDRRRDPKGLGGGRSSGHGDGDGHELDEE